MKTIIDKSKCSPLSEHIKGKLVIVTDKFFKPQYKEAKYQLVLATGGFGCDAGNLGSAVFVTDCCENPENYRVERFDLIGEPTEELIAEWKSKYGEFNSVVLGYLQKGE